MTNDGLRNLKALYFVVLQSIGTYLFLFSIMIFYCIYKFYMNWILIEEN